MGNKTNGKGSVPESGTKNVELIMIYVPNFGTNEMSPCGVYCHQECIRP